MALYIHHGPQLAPLATGVVDRLTAIGSDPFERRVVAVPTAGVRDWLTRRIASDVGVAANIWMPYPGRFFAAAVGLDDDEDPWRVERLTWAVLDVLDDGGVDVPGWVPRVVGAAAGRPVAAVHDRAADRRPVRPLRHDTSRDPPPVATRGAW